MIRVSYFYCLAGFLAITILSACDNSLEDDKRFAEEKNIESYISSKKLIYTKSNGVYHVATTPSYGYEINNGDTVEFWYKGYTLESTPLVFDTNIKSIARSEKLDTNVRDFVPMRVIAGKTELVEGLKRGLLLARQNQQSTIIFTSDLGFKAQIIGPLAAWSSLAYDIEIIRVNGIGIEREEQILNSMDLTGFSKHTSGLYYKYISNPDASSPAATSVVYGWYKCTLADGSVVSEITTPNAEINLNSNIIAALRVGFTLLKTGGSAQFVAPSPLCFGKTGNEMVDPYQPLLISIRLDSIK